MSKLELPLQITPATDATPMEQAIEQFIVLSSQIEQIKVLYENRNLLVMQMKELGFTNGEYGNLKLTLVDNFEIKNTVWRMAPVSRFEIRITKEKS